MIFFSISIFFLFTSVFYSDPIPDGKEWFYKNNIHHNYVLDYLPKFSINPFDYYVSWLEDAIIMFSMTFGVTFFLVVVKTAFLEICQENYKYEKKQNIKPKEKIRK